MLAFFTILYYNINMDKDLHHLLETESARQNEQAIVEASVDFEMMTARESAASCLVEHGALREELRGLVTAEQFIELASLGQFNPEMSELIYAANDLSSAVFNASYNGGEEFAVECLATMLHSVDVMEHDPEPWIGAARQLMPHIDILGDVNTPLDEVTQALRDKHTDMVLERIKSEEVRDRARRAAQTALSQVVESSHDDLDKALFSVVPLISVLHQNIPVEDIRMRHERFRMADLDSPIVAGSESSLLDVAQQALDLMREEPQ